MEDLYRRILVAKFSPDNGCFAPDGEILTVIPKNESPPTTSVDHYFVGIHKPYARSKFGWVREVEPFSLVSFINQYKLINEATPAEIDHVRVMLQAISKIAQNNAVAATYSLRGIMKKEIVFTVHKVFFY